jgi:hypothetical protein
VSSREQKCVTKQQGGIHSVMKGKEGGRNRHRIGEAGERSWEQMRVPDVAILR